MARAGIQPDQPFVFHLDDFLNKREFEDNELVGRKGIQWHHVYKRGRRH